jgi:hypothetical protein
VAHGHGPAGQKTTERGTPTIAELAERFLSEHVETKRKPGTAAFYRHILMKIVTPELGTSKADKVTRTQITKLHAKLYKTPFQANRVLAVMGSMYAFAGRTGAVQEGTNPIRKIDKFKEHRRERFLTGAELERLGQPSERQRRKAFRGSLMKRSPRQDTFQSQKIAIPRSARSRRRPFASCCSPDAGCGKSCISGGNTSILSVACCFFPTARAAARL